MTTLERKAQIEQLRIELEQAQCDGEKLLALRPQAALNARDGSTVELAKIDKELARKQGECDNLANAITAAVVKLSEGMAAEVDAEHAAKHEKAARVASEILNADAAVDKALHQLAGALRQRQTLFGDLSRAGFSDVARRCMTRTERALGGAAAVAGLADVGFARVTSPERRALAEADRALLGAALGRHADATELAA